MKIKIYFIVLAILTSCNNIPKEDIYKENHIRYSYQNKEGQKEENRELNDQIYLDVYVPDYTKDKGEEVCDFYDRYFKGFAKGVNNRLTINVDIWSTGVGRNELNNPILEKKYYKGGLIHNYKNDVKELNCYEGGNKFKEPDTIIYYQKKIIKEGGESAIREYRFMVAFLYSDLLQDTAKTIELSKEFLELYPERDKIRESVRMMLLMMGEKEVN